MHGHRLRLQAEHNRVNLWTDITVGAVYGAMKRLAAEGLLRESGREQEGNRPPGSSTRSPRRAEPLSPPFSGQASPKSSFDSIRSTSP